MKLINTECVKSILSETGALAKYKHQNGELSNVAITVAGLGTKRVRVANLPPEVNDTFLAIQEEMWANSYRYAVANGIRQVTIMLTKHIPSHFTVAGTRVLLSYDGQPTTCYGCGETCHIFQSCPKRQTRGPAPATIQRDSCVAIAAQTVPSPEQYTTVRAQDDKSTADDENTEHMSLPLEETVTVWR